MRTADLEAAYDQLRTVAQAITPETVRSPEDWADVDWTLCHVALSNRLLGDAARSILENGPDVPLVIDNLPATDPPVMAAMIASTTHGERIEAVRASAADFLAQVGKIAGDAARASLTFRIHDRAGNYVTDSTVVWSELMRLRAQEHLPSHSDRLRGYITAAT
jgi:hypothetical protein